MYLEKAFEDSTTMKLLNSIINDEPKKISFTLKHFETDLKQ